MMADSFSSSDQRSDNYYRGRGFQQGRPSFRGRGRGRGRGEDRFYNAQRALNELGVSDLREHLNRKHQQDQARGGPPSDPPYKYLKDPTRDYNSLPKGSNLQCSHSFTSKSGNSRDPIRDYDSSPKGSNLQYSNSFTSKSGNSRDTIRDYDSSPKGSNLQYSNSFTSKSGYSRDTIRDYDSSPKGSNLQYSNSFTSKSGHSRDTIRDYDSSPKGSNLQYSNSFTSKSDNLRDAIRDYDSSPKGSNLKYSNNFNSRRGRGKPKFQEQTFIHNPRNIKIELSTLTGQRNYSVDEDSILPDIKHIPDHPHLDNKARGSRSVGARGKIRFNTEDGYLRAKSTERKYEKKYDSRGSQVRSRSVETGGEYSNEIRGRGVYRPRGNHRGRSRIDNRPEGNDNDFRGRGRGRGRGRSFRGGRGGQQSYTSTNVPQEHGNIVTPEDNWDADLTTTPVDKDYNESGDYTVGNSSEDTNEHNREDLEDPDIEENIVVTSSAEDKSKRTVRFSLKNNEVKDVDENDENAQYNDNINNNEDEQIEEMKG